MSDPADLIEISLQILFGLLGFLLAILAIHYRDSLCSVLLRRWRRQPVTIYYELEAGCVDEERWRQRWKGLDGSESVDSRGKGDGGK